VRVYRELEKIDLVLEFLEIKLVIGIENKIWADEQEKQLDRYQEISINLFPNYTKELVLSYYQISGHLQHIIQN